MNTASKRSTIGQIKGITLAATAPRCFIRGQNWFPPTRQADLLRERMKMKTNLLAAGMFLTALADGFGQPVITAQPQSQTNVVGSTLTLAVEATGTQRLSYQWRKGGVTVTGATDATLLFTDLQSSNAGNYTVVVTNIEGAVTSAVALVRVIVPPNITVPPTN